MSDHGCYFPGCHRQGIWVTYVPDTPTTKGSDQVEYLWSCGWHKNGLAAEAKRRAGKT